MVGDTVSWVDVVSAASAAASALFVVFGGGWALYRFRKEAPFLARANLDFKAELLTHQGQDLIRATCTASAIGQGRFLFDRTKEPPFVSVFALTPALLRDPPARWTGPRATLEIFRTDESVEAGEVLQEVDLVWVGERVAETVAYRVVATFVGTDALHGKDFRWISTVVVPVEAVLDGSVPTAPATAQTVEVAR